MATWPFSLVSLSSLIHGLLSDFVHAVQLAFESLFSGQCMSTAQDIISVCYNVSMSITKNNLYLRSTTHSNGHWAILSTTFVNASRIAVASYRNRYVRAREAMTWWRQRQRQIWRHTDRDDVKRLQRLLRAGRSQVGGGCRGDLQPVAAYRHSFRLLRVGSKVMSQKALSDRFGGSGAPWWRRLMF